MGWFQKLSEGLSKTRHAVTGQLDRLLGRAADPALLDELEVALISADLGMPVVERVMENLRAQMRGGNFSAAEKVRELLRQSVLDILLPAQAASIDQLIAQGPRPFVILAVGVNGVGKTTTVAKLTQRFRQQGKTALLVAGDTFRAAAIDQLQVWADRTQVDIIRHRPGADPAAVAYDGITAAKARGSDVVLIDTGAGIGSNAVEFAVIADEVIHPVFKAHIQHDAGVQALEVDQPVRHHHLPVAARHAQAHTPLQALAQRGNGLARGQHFVLNGAAMGIQAQAHLGGLHPARGAAHQLHAHRLFQLVQVVAHVGPRHFQIAGCLAQVARVQDVHQHGERSEFHNKGV